MNSLGCLLIGLTGGIGSGKSTVSSYLRSQGIKVIDADQISRTLTQANGAAIPSIRKVFGDHVIDEYNALNRVIMRQIVFSDTGAKKLLEGIIHPLVKEQMIQQAKEAESPYIVFDIPLLIESIQHYRLWLDRICVIDCEVETQVKRVMKRNGLTEEVVRQIISQQASRAERLSYADDIIDNGEDTSIDSLHRQIYQLHLKWLEST